MKTVEISDGRPSKNAERSIDDWVEGKKQDDKEPTKRLTIDVSISLHKRIKSQCALADLVMADEIRDLLDRRFPAAKTDEGTTS